LFEEVLPVNAPSVIKRIAPHLNGFYLAGGTGLALQLGHRRSADLDFFIDHSFNNDLLISTIKPDKVILTNEGTLHCELEGVKVSFLYYATLCIFPAIMWKKINLADWRDIAAEKIKTISQRGSKKDFYDLFAVIKLKLPIDQVCRIFRERFPTSVANYYHVLRSLTFFEEAEEEPAPDLIRKRKDWEWKIVKRFFIKNIKSFEREMFL